MKYPHISKDLCYASTCLSKTNYIQISEVNESRFDFCSKHLHHLDFVYSNGVCIAHDEGVLAGGSIAFACDKFQKCTKDVDAPVCTMQLINLENHDFYQVSACSFLALHEKPQIYSNYSQNYDPIPFLHRVNDSSWSCSANQIYVAQWFHDSCDHFIVTYCKRILNCLKNFEISTVVGTKNAVLFGNLPLKSLGPWQLYFYQSVTCQNKVVKAYSQVVKHQNFPNAVSVKRSNGQLICHWSPFLKSDINLDSKFPLSNWLRVVHLQCDAMQRCLAESRHSQRPSVCSTKRPGRTKRSSFARYSNGNILAFHYNFHFKAFSSRVNGYPFTNSSCLSTQSEVRIFLEKDLFMHPNLAYKGFFCVARAGSIPCKTFVKECSFVKECIEATTQCQSHESSFNFHNLTFTNKREYDSLQNKLEMVVRKCQQGHSSELIHSELASKGPYNPMVVHSCSSKKSIGCDKLSILCIEREHCFKTMKPCQFQGQEEGRYGIRNFIDIPYNSTFLHLVHFCNFKYGFKKFVSLRHGEMELNDFLFVAFHFLKVSPYQNWNFQNHGIKNLNWYCKREKFVHFSCAEFISVCREIAQCLTREALNTNNEQEFAIKEIVGSQPQKCYISGKGLSISTIEITNQVFSLREYVWGDVFSQNVNDISTASDFGQNIVFSWCATTSYSIDEDVDEIYSQQLVVIIEECDMKINQNFASNVKAIVDKGTVTVTCCPPHAPWNDLSCSDWAADCNKLLQCFNNWRLHVMPLHRKVRAIFYGPVHWILCLTFGTLSLLIQCIVYVVDDNDIQFLSLFVDIFTSLWITLISSLFGNIFSKDFSPIFQLYTYWIFLGIVSAIIYVLSYLQACRDILKCIEIQRALRSLQLKNDFALSQAWIGYSFAIIVNVVRVILDSAIVASVCSIFHGAHFDALSFAFQPEHISKLADMHARIRSGSQDIKSTYFLYHPSCYGLSIFISQSWAFFLFFIGIDSLVLHITPLILRIVNFYLVVDSINESNRFRKQCNVKLIPLLTPKIVSSVLEISFQSILTMIYFVAVSPFIWNDTQGMFMDKNLTLLKHMYFTNSILNSFTRHSVRLAVRLTKSSWINKA